MRNRGDKIEGKAQKRNDKWEMGKTEGKAQKIHITWEREQTEIYERG